MLALGQRLRLAPEAVRADAETRVRLRQPLTVKAALLKPPADQRHPIGRAPLPGPDDGAAGLAQLAARADGPLDVLVSDIAEHPADQHQIRRRQAAVVISDRGITSHDLHPIQSGGTGPRLRDRRNPRVQLHQACPDVIPPGMISEYPEQITALTGTQANHLQRARPGAIQHRPDLQLDRLQPPRQRRARTVVVIVPAMPVHGAHPTAAAPRSHEKPGPGSPARRARVTGWVSRLGWPGGGRRRVSRGC